MNLNWPRWIHASLVVWMKANVAGLPVYAETDKQPDSSETDKLEFNWIGPKILQSSQNSFILTLNLVVLVSTLKSPTNAYQAYTDQGLGLQATPTCIPVHKYGNQVGDDETLLGILVRQGPIIPYMVGHQEQSNRIRQVGLTANYRMDI